MPRRISRPAKVGEVEIRAICAFPSFRGVKQVPASLFAFEINGGG